VTDAYARLAGSPLGRLVAPRVGLPQPVELERHAPGRPVVDGLVLLGAAPGGRLAAAVAELLAAYGAGVATELRDDVRAAAAGAGLDAAVWNPAAPAGQRFKALVFDATGIAASDELAQLHAFFSPTARRVARCGRVVVLGTPPAACPTPRAATAQRALEGFTRSLGKEVRAGSTVQLVRVAPGAEAGLGSTLRFLLSPRSAYVSGQVVSVGDGAEAPPPADPERPQAGRVAVVTGAARGIGAAIVGTLARDGAHVVGLDVPALARELDGVTAALGGSSLPLDITAEDAPGALAAHLEREHGGAGVVVHNAGITRDKTIARMSEEQWRAVLDVNLSAAERLNDALLERGVLGEHGRIVCVSSISGIAGNAGQTNYATSKAGVIGMVQALAPVLAARGATINAVAPGFIETRMTAEMPLVLREAGRRMNSLSQGGLPVDVAETIAWLADPASGGVNGNVVRVCGQSLLGA
jgi:3-oxoacyl-[acyl-carrier protein] reductase